MAARLVSPSAEAVSLARAKQYLRVEHNEDDGLIRMLISAACQRAESITGMQLMEQDWRLFVSPSQRIELPIVPVRSVLQVRIINPAGIAQTLNPADYQLISIGHQRAWLVPASSWPSLANRRDAMQIDVRCGLASQPDELDDAILNWLLLRVGTAYEQRQAVVEGQLTELPASFVDGLLDPYRIVRL